MLAKKNCSRGAQKHKKKKKKKKKNTKPKKHQKTNKPKTTKKKPPKKKRKKKKKKTKKKKTHKNHTHLGSGRGGGESKKDAGRECIYHKSLQLPDPQRGKLFRGGSTSGRSAWERHRVGEGTRRERSLKKDHGRFFVPCLPKVRGGYTGEEGLATGLDS